MRQVRKETTRCSLIFAYLTYTRVTWVEGTSVKKLPQSGGPPTNVCGAFSWLLIGIEGFNPLLAVPSVGRWA